jgi:predicted glycosyltransferase
LGSQTAKVRRRGGRARLWIDVLTPRHALFAHSIARVASSFNLECFVTSANYPKLQSFISKLGLRNNEPIGKPRADSDLPTIESELERQERLVSFVGREKRFDFSLSFLSQEAARVSFGLGIPHFVCADSPHLFKKCKLCLPLAAALFTPFVIPKTSWIEYGKTGKEIARYRGTEPWSWVRDGRVIGKTRKSLRGGKTLVILDELFRFADEDKRKKLILEAAQSLVKGIKKEWSESSEIWLFPPHGTRSEIEREFGSECKIADYPSDAFFMTFEARIVIGGVGTAIEQAALQGVPNISFAPESGTGNKTPPVFERFYFPKLLSRRAKTLGELEALLKEMLSRIDSEKKMFLANAMSATRDFEDPATFVVRSIFSKR